MRNGAVGGLVVERNAQRFDIAANAVVLASGGYEWNSELCARFLPGPLTHPTSPPGNEGDGLLMAMEVGADLANMNEAWWYPAAAIPGETYDGQQLARFIAVERTAPHSIIVNRFGHRFVNEAANYNDMQKAFFAFDANEGAPRNLPSWVIFDHQFRSKYSVVTARPGTPDPAWLAVNDTLDGLATAVGIDPAGLGETVQRWNGMVAAGRDRDFGRGDSFYDRFHGDPTTTHPNLGTIERGPFYALPVHLGTVGTSGGPRIDSDGRVQHVRDRPIPGLYGAGNAIASPAGPAYYGGGTTIGMALVWGHIAGAHAASTPIQNIQNEGRTIMSTELAGKVAIVTGGAAGIGRTCVERFAAEGARVVIADIDPEAGNAAATELGDSVAFARTDVTDAAQVQALVDFTVERFGGLHIMLNNAGVASSMTRFLHDDLSDFTRVVNINLLGVLLGSQRAAMHMKAHGGGSIINTSSTSGIQAGVGLITYRATKAAVIHSSRSIALELAQYNIRVNCLVPGQIQTGMTTYDMENVMKFTQPLPRKGRQEDVAEAAIFLASDRAAHITGIVLPVDGGTTAGPPASQLKLLLGAAGAADSGA